MNLFGEVVIRDVNLVPWSATEVSSGTGKHTGRRWFGKKKNPRLVAFQAFVARTAQAQMGSVKAHDGPCFLDMYLMKRTEDEALWGEWCYVPLGEATNKRGDLTNLIKAIEDGLEKVMFVKDQLVCATRSQIYWADSDMVIARVYTLDRPGVDSFTPTLEF